MSYRRTAGVLALAVLMTTAGCGFITGSESLSFSANQATVSDATLSETGYEEVSVEAANITRNFSAAGQERQVEVTNWIAQYERQVSLGPLGDRRAAVFAGLSTPAVEILGQTFNPVANFDNRQIIQRFQKQYDSVSVGDRVDTAQVEALGEERNVSRYEGTAQLAGNDVDVYIHLAKFRHGDDYVVALAVYPQRLDGERSRAVSMFEGVEHEN